ncbi:hypothetical protein [Winogradskyella sp. PC D3.3]
MKVIKLKNLLLLLLIVNFSCNTEIKIKDYSERLKIDFPADMNLIYFNRENQFQDYSILSIYKLSFNQKNFLLDEIIGNLCNSLDENVSSHSLHWHRCDDFYSYNYTDQEKGVIINVIFVAKNNISTVTIQEIKI